MAQGKRPFGGGNRWDSEVRS